MGDEAVSETLRDRLAAHFAMGTNTTVNGGRMME